MCMCVLDTVWGVHVCDPIPFFSFLRVKNYNKGSTGDRIYREGRVC